MRKPFHAAFWVNILLEYLKMILVELFGFHIFFILCGCFILFLKMLFVLNLLQHAMLEISSWRSYAMVHSLNPKVVKKSQVSRYKTFENKPRSLISIENIEGINKSRYYSIEIWKNTWNISNHNL